MLRLHHSLRAYGILDGTDLFSFQLLQDRKMPLIYSPIEIPKSLSLPSYHEDLGYLIGTILTVVWTVILLYPAICRFIDSRKHTTTVRRINS